MIVQVKVMRLALSSLGPFPTNLSRIRDLQIHLQPASSRAKAKQHAFDQAVSPPHGSHPGSKEARLYHFSSLL